MNELTIIRGYEEHSGQYYAYVNQFDLEFFGISEVSAEDALLKLTETLAERLYRINQIVRTGQIKG